MIPAIEEIVAALLAGKINAEQANAWLNQHVEIARDVDFTTRDHFAAKAMEGFIVNRSDPDNRNARLLDLSEVAASSYAMADAMLRARQS